MATTGKWDMSNWVVGPVTLPQALGYKGKITFPKLTPQIAAAAAGTDSSATSASAGNTNGTTPANASETAYFTALLKSIGAPVTKANLDSLDDWYTHENSSWPPAAAYNPLNTTQPMPGATIFNSDGVRIYANATQGVSATATTLLNGYPGIVAALKAGNGLCGDTGLASEFLTWSGNGYSSPC